MRRLLDKRVLFFGGKGGVGKTTCASAMALAASRAGKRVLLVSTDPAHSTSDMFERPIGPEPVPLLPNLHGLEIDGAFETGRYVKTVKEQISGLFGHHILKEASRQIDLAASMPDYVTCPELGPIHQERDVTLKPMRLIEVDQHTV